MKPQEFLQLVLQMRRMQVMYRKTGDNHLLEELQDLEWRVDSYVAENIQQQKLF